MTAHAIVRDHVRAALVARAAAHPATMPAPVWEPRASRRLMSLAGARVEVLVNHASSRVIDEMIGRQPTMKIVEVRLDVTVTVEAADPATRESVMDALLVHVAAALPEGAAGDLSDLSRAPDRAVDPPGDELDAAGPIDSRAVLVTALLCTQEP